MGPAFDLLLGEECEEALNLIPAIDAYIDARKGSTHVSPGVGEWLQLRDLCVCLGYLAPPADIALPAPVCERGDACLFG